MKIIKGGAVIAELATRPKNLDCGSRGGIVSIVIDQKDVALAKYASREEASRVQQELCAAYLADADEFHLP